jgi:hypothetical protein
VAGTGPIAVAQGGSFGPRAILLLDRESGAVLHRIEPEQPPADIVIVTVG